MSWQIFLTVFLAAFLAQFVAGIFRSAVSSEELDEKLEVLKLDIIGELSDKLHAEASDLEE